MPFLCNNLNKNFNKNYDCFQKSQVKDIYLFMINQRLNINVCIFPHGPCCRVNRKWEPMPTNDTSVLFAQRKYHNQIDG